MLHLWSELGRYIINRGTNALYETKMKKITAQCFNRHRAKEKLLKKQLWEKKTWDEKFMVPVSFNISTPNDASSHFLSNF